MPLPGAMQCGIDLGMRQNAFISNRGNKDHAVSLIQIKAASDTFSSIGAGNGTEAATNPAITS